MTPRPSVTVLLATLDGREHLPEQLQSILDQDGVDVQVVVSDDMSVDGTWEWLLDAAAADPRITVLPRTGPSGGAAANFYRLLLHVDPAEAGCVALADQDDVWHADKLRTQVAVLQSGVDGVSSDVTAFWPDGSRVLLRKSWPQRRYDFLFEGPGPGCSYLLTPRLVRLLQSVLRDEQSGADRVEFHDWLVYAVCRARGWRWHIMDTPTLDYRQHAGNTFGANLDLRSRLHRLGLIAAKWHRRESLALAGVGVRVAGEAGRTDLERMHGLLERTGPGARVRLAARAGQLRRRPRDRVAIGALVLLGVW